MSEEIKEKLDLFPDNMNDIAKEAYYQLENYITSLQQKVEQLENIRKEVIEYIKDNACYSEGHCKCSFSQIALDNLLNILNKGENNE